ncbi:MAG: phytanoyl-CoA dioxygenase [Brevundimonas sp.]|nr:MAG: phytanoyl-CoA dioxygenase [Brevundimonas sp.]
MDGAQRFRCALSNSEVQAALAAFDHLPKDRAGLRLAGIIDLASLVSGDSALGCIAAKLIGRQSKPVRAILFDKSEATNWSLAWHQDRTVVVRQRIETAGYGPWSIKSGLTHVAPPFDILVGMATLRLHLDDVDENNAPLLIAPGSHRIGRVIEQEIPATVSRLGIASCLADSGDVWAYSTPILHASKAAALPRRRRVLQVDYANRDLDGGLEWLGV